MICRVTVIGGHSVVAVCLGQLARARQVLWGIATNLGELKCLSRPGTGARARGPRPLESLSSVGWPGHQRQRVPTGPVRREVHLKTGVALC